MFLGLFEPSETRLLAELLSPGDVFLDLGAHIGWFTTIASRRVGDGLVVAFEPYGPNATALRENLDRNACENVSVKELAVGSEEGTVELYVAHADSGTASVLWWTPEGGVDVPVVRLDTVAADLSSVAVMKIDIEGWEAQALRGGAKTLERTKHVLVEINPVTLGLAGSSPEEIFALLRAAGFAHLWYVEEGGVRRVQASEVHNVLASRVVPEGLSTRTIRLLRRVEGASALCEERERQVEGDPG